VLGHYRTDYPVADDQRWLGVAVLVGHDGQAPTVSRSVPTPEWRARRLPNVVEAPRCPSVNRQPRTGE
jgi:succinate dehydrogenase/fumarate reductase flavoprotein subunit